MRRNIPTFLAILLLGTLILCSACTSGNGKSGPDGGLSQIEAEEKSPYISFDEAKQEFGRYNSPDGSGAQLPVYYLYSRDMDRAGNAMSWLFGVRQGNGTVLLIYDRTGWKINPWNATLPSEEIRLEQIVPPGTLFARNTEAISGKAASSPGESRELVLKQGVYTLTIRSGSTSRILMFNAITGGQIQ